MVTIDNYKEIYEHFWKDIIENNGQIDKDQMMRELADYSRLIENAGKVYYAITDGKISKLNTDPDVVIGLAQECYEKDYE